MNSRRRNRLVTIKEPPTSQDAAGQITGDWTTVCSPWANVLYLNGLETVKAGADVSVAKASIRIGYRTDITPAMQVYLGTTVFKINAVLPDEARKQHTDLVCEVSSGG